MKPDKIILFIIFSAFIILGSSVFVASNFANSSTITESQEAKAFIEESSYNWGDIQMKNGVVTKTFSIKNVGSSNLELINIKTSCMCTTASIKTQDGQSPLLRMHQASSWKGIVPPGSTAELEVKFDSAYHGPTGIGKVNRQITVESNDASNKLLNFSVSANVIN